MFFGISFRRLMIFLLLVCVLIGISIITPIFSSVAKKVLDTHSKITLSEPTDKPVAIVVLGGGLTQDHYKNIILNQYSTARVEMANILHTSTDLPIITSGVESPWLADYLKEYGHNNPVIISENASMNTCENARFTAKLMAYHELPPTVYLVTDSFHMARARRQFALAGIQTIAYPSPVITPIDPFDFGRYATYSRRAFYETAALIRDIVAPQADCRTSEQISIEEISTPRRQPKIFSQR